MECQNIHLFQVSPYKLHWVPKMYHHQFLQIIFAKETLCYSAKNKPCTDCLWENALNKRLAFYKKQNEVYKRRLTLTRA